MALLTYSDYIYRIIEVVKFLGCSFDLYNKEKVFGNEEYGGRIDYDKAKIWIHCPESLEALRVIAHEGGHWLSFLLHGHDKYEDNFPRSVREVMADHYGWDLVCAVGVDNLISHASWLKECREERNDVTSI